MALIQRATELQSDAPPLWLPRHDGEVVEQASAQPPDRVDGYTAQARLTAAVLGSPWKMVTIGATAVAILAFVALVPSLLGAGVGSLLKLAIYHAWTIALLLIVTTRVRSVTVGSVVRYWLAGLFTVAMITSFVSGPISGLVESGTVWIVPVVEELLKAAVLGVAVFMGRRVWRHPGLCDLLILGFAVGAGFAFHEEALWERGAVSGFDLTIGLVVPSVFRPDGLLVVGHAVWAAMIGVAIGLFILHRRQPVAVVAAVVAVLVVMADRMAVNDTEGTLDVVRQLLFNGKLVAVLFLAGVAGSVVLDQRRLATTSVRDHLFPSAHSHAVLGDPNAEPDPLKSMLIGRYRRLRNGAHTTVNATTQQWPPRSESAAAPIAELARLGRAAGIAVGPGTSASGWAPDPEAPHGFRFVGPAGFTAYAAGTAVAPHGPTTTSISTPKARIEAIGVPRQSKSGDFVQYAGIGVAGVVVFAAARLFTAGDASAVVLETPFSLADATNSPSLIVGALGAIAAAVAIRGRDNAELSAGWEVGPGPDPSPNRTDECQA